MKASTKKYVYTVGIAILFISTLWIGGFDFDKRTPLIGYFFVIACFICGLVYTFPGYKDDE